VFKTVVALALYFNLISCHQPQRSLLAIISSDVSISILANDQGDIRTHKSKGYMARGHNLDERDANT
jgi:hypothetical protein